jgi:hypothetical protein
MAAQPEQTGLPELVALVYRADWTQLRLSGTVHARHDVALRNRMSQVQATGGPLPGLFGRWLRSAQPGQPQPGQTQPGPNSQPDAVTRGRVLLANGGRYRLELAVPDEDRGAADGGPRLTVCDGESQWEVGADAATREGTPPGCASSTAGLRHPPPRPDPPSTPWPAPSKKSSARSTRPSPRASRHSSATPTGSTRPTAPTATGRTPWPWPGSTTASSTCSPAPPRTASPPAEITDLGAQASIAEQAFRGTLCDARTAAGPVVLSAPQAPPAAAVPTA